MKRIVLNVLAFCLLAPVAEGQPLGRNVSKVGTTAATFLEIPVGARAIGMGGAFVGSADDVTGLYWNPAGIARLPWREAIFSHSEWIVDMKFDYAALSLPMEGVGSLGFSFTSLTMADMPVRTVDRPEGTGELFSAGSFSVGLHYARNLSDKFAIGFTVKYIAEHIWNMEAEAFALDVGTIFTTDFLNGMRIGASI
ncbi:MAG: PorV/PorQ family protein, partial [Ignavibacteria bacterium]|nr:PorV/PorQ family protein [Ignavibacteria bacterium]